MDIFMHISTERALQATVELIRQKHAHYNLSSAHGHRAFFRLLVPVLFLDNLCPQFDVSSLAAKQILPLTKSAGSMRFHPE
jgi:hypothetical protein